ncbi:hypothetical protein T4A_2153 [Trichinella pseudospiralis]|uniref:Uncharacterized protein n=1 Tax=Trichinella pseudospiralis TaxID=6337 RepID=A0A0V1E9M1_TRIPS|nr:hypothetical protein T4A_2153 [Trichinella pseudospiralis]
MVDHNKRKAKRTDSRKKKRESLLNEQCVDVNATSPPAFVCHDVNCQSFMATFCNSLYFGNNLKTVSTRGRTSATLKNFLICVRVLADLLLQHNRFGRKDVKPLEVEFCVKTSAESLQVLHDELNLHVRAREGFDFLLNHRCRAIDGVV